MEVKGFTTACNSNSRDSNSHFWLQQEPAMQVVCRLKLSTPAHILFKKVLRKETEAEDRQQLLWVRPKASEGKCLKTPPHLTAS